MTFGEFCRDSAEKTSFFAFAAPKFGNIKNSIYLCSEYKCILTMSKQEKEEKAKEFWEYYEATQGTITITDSVVLD